MSDRRPTPEEEAEWIRRIATGDREAFEALHRAFARPVFGFLVRLLRDDTKAEELTNDVLLEVWKGAGRFRGQARPSTWIFGIAHHKAMSELRRHRPAIADAEELAQIANGREGPETMAARTEQREKLRRALDSLSAEHREVIQLAFERGFSCRDIARIAKCPVNTVKTRMFYARKKLQAALRNLGVSWELI